MGNYVVCVVVFFAENLDPNCEAGLLCDQTDLAIRPRERKKAEQDAKEIVSSSEGVSLWSRLFGSGDKSRALENILTASKEVFGLQQKIVLRVTPVPESAWKRQNNAGAACGVVCQSFGDVQNDSEIKEDSFSSTVLVKLDSIPR